MTKQELELMESFNKLEIALSNLASIQANTRNTGTIYWNHYSNFIDAISMHFYDTKKKFHEILVEKDEEP